MKTLLEPEPKTPGIFYDDSQNFLTIQGRIIPENPESFFNDFDRIFSSTLQEQNQITLIFDLEYFNTGAARYLYKFFVKISKLGGVKVKWIYESDDEDIFESGKEYEELTGLSFIYEVK